MYQVLCDGAVIYDPRAANSSDKLILRKPVVKLAVGSAGSMTFTIDPTHPLISTLQRMASIITVTEDGTPFFTGRIIQDTKGFRGERNVTVEGMLAALNDSVFPPYNFPDDYLEDPDYLAAVASGNVVAFFLGKLIDWHNSNVGASQQIQLGTVSVTDPNNYIARSSEDPMTTWNIIQDKLVNSSLGGYILVDYSGTVPRLDYVSGFSTEGVQEVTFGVNLQDLKEQRSGGDLFTAVYPVGKDGLSIKGLQDGEYSGFTKQGAVLYDPDAEAVYGRITRLIEYPDITVDTNLLTRAVTALQDESGAMPQKITIKACDLHAIDGSLPSFRPGQLVRVVSEPHGYDASIPLMSVEINLIDPSSTPMQLSAEGETYTAAFDKQKADVSNAINDIKGTVAQQGQDLTNRIITAETSVQQTADAVTAQASVTDGLVDQIAALQVAADAVTIRVQNILDNGVGKVQTEMGYTFDDEGLKIQKEGESIESKVDNTGMYVTRSGEHMLIANASGVEAADLHATTYLRIGRYSRIEDYDDGADHYRTGIFYIGP